METILQTRRNQMPTVEPLVETNLGFPRRQGKVRDVYTLEEQLLIVSTDRISAFDWILPVGIPGKGRVLTQLSKFWFDYLDVEHHLISTELPNALEIDDTTRAQLEGRVMCVRKAEVIPFECVVRGYLEGSGWREYQETGAVCGVQLPSRFVVSPGRPDSARAIACRNRFSRPLPKRMKGMMRTYPLTS